MWEKVKYSKIEKRMGEGVSYAAGLLSRVCSGMPE